MKSRLIVVGAAGRMGSRIISLAADSVQFDIVAAVDRQGHPDMGKDVGVVSYCRPIGIMLTDTWADTEADVLIDFSLPESTETTIDYCLDKKIALVCGTTGLSDTQREKMKAASERIPILYATNMSVGMNVLFALVGKVASILGDEYDIEIIEQHHRFKRDAPSGTALTLAENICKMTKRDFPESVILGRSGKDSLRQKGKVGIHSVRAGDITGVHSVMFGTLGETVSINHTANSRDAFAHGALRAAKWIIAKEPSLYSMADVLGIED